MIILGIDPGTAKMGYAVIETTSSGDIPLLKECSCLITSPDLEMPKRLKFLYDELSDITKRHTPDIMVIEKLFFNTNAKTAIAVGQARGVSLLTAAHGNMSVVEYTALEAKFVLTGYGRSSKKEMQEAIKKYMRLKDILKPDDANDALAMALCFLDKDYKTYAAS